MTEDDAAAHARVRPPFDEELQQTLVVLAEVLPSSILPAMVEPMRARQTLPPDGLLPEDPPGLTRTDHVVPGHAGGTVTVSVVAREDHAAPGPAIVYLHGGGMVMGNRFTGFDQALAWVRRYDAVCVTVEYRLAPEHPDPTPVEDCYAALCWVAAHAEMLGVDPAVVVLAGVSAGGGLAAGAALLARDRRGPPLAGQLLMYPMLDDRDDSVSARQVDGEGVWDRTSNETGWTALLGARRGTSEVSPYAAPARAEDLSGLPPTYVDVGSVEVFRDEDVAYASRVWACGGIAELHVWPGGFHGFDILAPDAVLSTAMVAARVAWLDRLLRH